MSSVGVCRITTVFIIILFTISVLGYSQCKFYFLVIVLSAILHWNPPIFKLSLKSMFNKFGFWRHEYWFLHSCTFWIAPVCLHMLDDAWQFWWPIWNNMKECQSIFKLNRALLTGYKTTINCVVFDIRGQGGVSIWSTIKIGLMVFFERGEWDLTAAFYFIKEFRS